MGVPEDCAAIGYSLWGRSDKCSTHALFLLYYSCYCLNNSLCCYLLIKIFQKTYWYFPPFGSKWYQVTQKQTRKSVNYFRALAWCPIQSYNKITALTWAEISAGFLANQKCGEMAFQEWKTKTQNEGGKNRHKESTPTPTEGNFPWTSVGAGLGPKAVRLHLGGINTLERVPWNYISMIQHSWGA